MPTRIDWCDEVWNPVTGCTKISEGCEHCYAERMARRMAGRMGYHKIEPFRITYHEDRLNLPMKWRKPKSIFVNSMGDLFHDDVPEKIIGAIYSVMEICRQHTFLVLTKRPERMADLLASAPNPHLRENIWHGITVENHEQYEKRIHHLMRMDGKKFLSVEPMLGPILPQAEILDGMVDAVICGGETGPGARPMNPDWVYHLLEQCEHSGTPFFFKGWGEWRARDVYGNVPPKGKYGKYPDAGRMCMRVGKKMSGRELGGRTYDYLPWQRIGF